MWPKEHGAYGQLAFPLITGLAVGGVTFPVMLTMVAAVAAFLSFEPALVLLGHRGPRARRDHGRRAVAWLAAVGSVAVAAGAAAVWLAPSHVRWSFALPLGGAAAFAAAVLAHREKSAGGEIIAAAAFASIAMPIGLTAAVPTAVAVSVTSAFALLSGASTLGVRVVILRVRGGGDPRAVQRTRRLQATLGAAAVATLAVAASRDMLPWIPLLAVAPGLAVATVLALRPPPPARLRTVGWTLLATSAVASAVLVVGLRSW